MRARTRERAWHAEANGLSTSSRRSAERGPHTGRTYSLMRGGLVYALIIRMLGKTPRYLHVWLAVALGALGLLPIMAVTAFNGTLFGRQVDVPLLMDFSTLARFLLVVPLLVVAAPTCDRLMRLTLSYVPRCGLVPCQKKAAFDRLLARVWSLRDPHWPEAAFLLLAFSPVLFAQTTFDAMPGVASWRSVDDAAGRFAAGWLDLVSLPLFRFIVLLWLWRFAMWTYLLWRMSWLHLRLDAGHPDGSGGILFLGESQFRFVVLALAGAILISASCMNHVVHLGETIEQQKPILFGYIMLAVGCLVSPLLLLARRLFRVKQRALLSYSELGHMSATEFGQRWLQAPASRSLLDSGDTSAVAAYGALYATVRRMSILPITRTTLMWFVLVTASPFVPLLVVAMPLEDLVNRLISAVA